ncbi:MAG TPA: hypothetical protein VFC19_48805 [Candidatus Limnocylindrales bacterium]|nr:hypothetical protein [Candidatus Limnocylindrales bacterium]
MVVDVLISTEEGLHDTADRLRDASRHYTGTDQVVSRNLDGLR